MKKPYLSHSMLINMLKYDPDSGHFTWLKRNDARPQWNGRYAGKRAGYAREATGGGLYWSVRIFDWPFHAGPLAWFYMTGEWPTQIVDHVDGNGLNNCWSNLRLATKAQNAANSKRTAANTSGFKGVSLHRKSRLWRATIRRDGRQVFLGNYTNPEEAHAAYIAAAKEIHGKYARAE